MVESRAQRHDAGRIYIELAVVTFLDLLQIESLLDPRPLIKLAQVIAEIRVVLNAAQIALEVTVINQVEAQQRRERAPVRLGDALPRQVSPLTELFFQSVETYENLAPGVIVSLLAAREAGAVDAVVEVAVNEIVDAVDFAA